MFQGWVASVADDEGSEDATDSSTRSSHSNCGSSGTNEFGGRVNVPGHSRGLKGAHWGGSNQGLLRGLLGQQGIAGRSQVHLRSWGQLQLKLIHSAVSTGDQSFMFVDR